MAYIPERGSTHVYIVNKISKEEIHEMAERCVCEEPPFCNAACPLKLDTKAMLAAAAQGDFSQALRIIERAAPFPHVLSAGCEAPCEQRCRLGEKGDAVAIRAIERAAVRYGGVSRGGSVFRMKKRRRAAIFGAGLFSLFLAGELEKKAYPVTVFCEEAGEREYLEAAAPFLNSGDFDAELERLWKKEIDFVFGCRLDAEFFEREKKKFDILCASKEAAERICPGADWDEKTMFCRERGLILGVGGSVLGAAFGAKKAALTADRLAQGLDPGSARGDEGACESRLYTKLDGAEKLTRIPEREDGYSAEEAAGEAGRCIQCFCDECVKACAYLQHYGKTPALMTRELYNNTQIIMGDHQMNKPMNACALCGQCEVICPNGFDMAQVCRSARRNMVSTDKMPNAPHEFALLDMLFSNGEAALCRRQPGHDTCRYVFFPGCQAAAIAPGTVRAAYEDLCKRVDGGVALLLGCCGAIADWAGRETLYEQTVSLIDERLAALGNPSVIVLCPSCEKELKRHGTEVIGIWDVLLALGLPEGGRGLDCPAALHDACGARGDRATQEAVREIARQLGCEIIETAYAGDEAPCCGYGGLAAYANPEVARKMTAKCLERADAPYVSYCMACRDRFAREGRASHHILELVYGTDAGVPPDISEKRGNRLTLKNTLLRELWEEETEMRKADYKIEYTPEVLAVMDRRMILKDDVIETLDALRETGEAIYDAQEDVMITRRRIGNVTFWVKYREIEGGYRVVGAYSHRMDVVRRP